MCDPPSPLQDFLQAGSLESVPPKPAARHGDPAIILVGDYTWDSRALPTLVDVELKVPAGQLVVVVGTTGSGKTTLLSAMLGQMQQVGPDAADRDAWLFL